MILWLWFEHCHPRDYRLADLPGSPFIVGWRVTAHMAILIHQQDSQQNQVMKKAKFRKVYFLSQNVRGVKSNARLEELFYVMSCRNILAACLQETWRYGKEIVEYGQSCMISSGLDKPTQGGNRGSQGVAIVLSPDGVAAWKAAGSEAYTNFGPRVIAIRLLLKDSHNKDVGVYLVSMYSPVGNSPDNVWDDYFDRVSACLNQKRDSDLLVIGCDCNSSMGTNDNGIDSSLGRYGIQYVNDSGKRFLSFLSTNNLKVATTCFKKKQYATWIHPRSKNLHQIDHMIVNRDMFHRCTDAGIAPPNLDSDHNATFLCIRVMRRLKRKAEPRDRLNVLDYSGLSVPDTRTAFNNEVKNLLHECNDPNYSDMANAVSTAASTLLPKRTKAQPGWFRDNEVRIQPLIESRNEAIRDVFKRRTRLSMRKLRTARKNLKEAVKKAKNIWIAEMCDNINTNVGTKAAWDSVKLLKRGLSKVTVTSAKRMKRGDGSLCTTPEENASVFKEHFQQLYERNATFDPSVLELLPQTVERTGFDHPPSDEEIRSATLDLKNKAPWESGIMAQLWKSILDCPDLFRLLKIIVMQFWENEVVPNEWNTGRLIILPKKGGLS